MRGSECKLVAFLDGGSKRFVIPVYQRTYDWKIENCKRLFDDLLKMIRQNRPSHFFGSIVSVYNPEGLKEEFHIIDGQQRLTTVSLLLLAMYHLIREQAVTPADPMLADKIFEQYLVDKYQPKETRLKLKPVKNDQTAFSKLFEEPKEHVRDSNLTANYNFFREQISQQHVSVDALYAAIFKLEIISITLNADDNPQLIFESLNSTGLALSEGDKIRNYVLMGQPPARQNELYERYWSKIERHTGDELSAFVRDYLSIKQQSIPAMSKVYFAFKDYVEDGEIETEDLLRELLLYAELFDLLLHGGMGDKALDACIYRMNRLDTTVTRPFFLEVLRLMQEQKLTVPEVREVLLTTESYLFRRTICELPTNALNKIFLLLHREILRYDGTTQDYVAKFQYALSAKRERARFPDDAEFIAAFETRAIYPMNSKHKLYMLERFENCGTAEDKDVYRHCDAGDYTIEHIMPQHLTPVWVQTLGEDYERIHEEWLHRVANLTLTAYNGTYSNRPFSEKRNEPHGYQESGLRMNQKIAEIGANDVWGLPELERRNALLMEQALVNWPAPESNFRPAERQADVYTLEDDNDLTGRTLVRFRFQQTEQPVESWADMFERVVSMLHDSDKTVLMRLAGNNDPNTELSAYINNRSEVFRRAKEIDSEIYVECNTSTWTKQSVLRRLFRLYHVDPSELVFYLKPENEEDETVLSDRQAMRKRYWAFALAQIQAEQGESGAFRNVHPTKGSWINGYFGINGFALCCVVTEKCARVEVYLGRLDADDNKLAFDHLYAHKQEIESAIDTPLRWSRGDGINSSKVYIQLDGVNITRESNWPDMAAYQATWCRKFMDVIVPYLKQLRF